MRARERRLVQVFRRAHEFVASAPAKYGWKKTAGIHEQLGDAIAALEAADAEQGLGMGLQMAATQRRAAIAQELRENYVLVLAQVGRVSDVESPGLAKAFRAPHKRVPLARLLQTARSMLSILEKRPGIQHGAFGSSFQRDMLDTIRRLETAIADADAPRRRHIVARATVDQEIRKARRAIRLLDVYIRRDSDPVLLSAWQTLRQYERNVRGKRRQ